jgi:tetratricopeptide (TPR) repeat protein
MREFLMTEPWIEEAISLRVHSSYEKAMAFLMSCLQDHPSDPRVYFHIACTHEESNQYTDAIYAFERAIDLGLVGEDLRKTFLSLGNLFYLTGECEKARDILVHAIRRFPGYRPYFAYLALTLHAVKEEDRSVQLLMQLVLDTTGDPELLAHSKTLLFYAQKLTAQS